MWKNLFNTNRPDQASLEKEVKELRWQNLRLKMHMQVLVGCPYSKTAGMVRILESKDGVYESIVNLN